MVSWAVLRDCFQLEAIPFKVEFWRDADERTAASVPSHLNPLFVLDVVRTGIAICESERDSFKHINNAVDPDDVDFVDVSFGVKNYGSKVVPLEIEQELELLMSSEVPADPHAEPEKAVDFPQVNAPLQGESDSELDLESD